MLSFAAPDVLSLASCLLPGTWSHIMLTQLRASVLLLLELLFVREGVFNCSLLSSHDIDEMIDFYMHFLMRIK